MDTINFEIVSCMSLCAKTGNISCGVILRPKGWEGIGEEG